MEFSFTDLIDVIIQAMRIVFQDNVPDFVLYIMAWGVLVLFALFVIYAFFLLVSKIISIVKDEFLPHFYDADEKRRLERRRRFAEHIEHEIRRLNSLEAWSDYRFAELEAEVEAEGKRARWLSFLPQSDGLRREPSLSEALKRSTERLILLEGDPGAGKSVALRHIALDMAQRAMKARNLKAVIPIYVNLKALKSEKNHESEQSMDQNVIREFVLRTLNRANDRDIDAFLDEEFERGLHEGTWLFLFDSFDEIPEILSSTEAGPVILDYAEAISDFLHGMNHCRGIVASREYRGPRHLSWSRFHILPLSEQRQIELIRLADLRNIGIDRVIGELGTAPHGMRVMSSNPMFLGLLCEYVQKKMAFPQNSYVVYEEYVQFRLDRDEERLRRRFGFETKQVREAAEKLAFCITADPNLGLNPTRASLEESTVRHMLGLDDLFNELLDALEFLKLARSETETVAGDSKPFTFAHRRFQEYFATSVVLREPNRVSAEQLLMDGRWRETSAVLLQTQSLDVLYPLLDVAECLLDEMITKGPLISNVRPERDEDVEQNVTHASDESENRFLSRPFSWPYGLLHLLSLLQDGLGDRSIDLPASIQNRISWLIATIWQTGTWLDKKWALEVAGVTPDVILTKMLKDAFRHDSESLRDVAYSQVHRLETLSGDIADSIRAALTGMALDGRLRRERYSTHAYLSRLDRSSHFLAVMRSLRWTLPVDLAVYFISTGLIFFTGLSLPSLVDRLLFSLLYIFPFLLLWRYSRLNLSSMLRLFVLGAVVFSLLLSSTNLNNNILTFNFSGIGFFDRGDVLRSICAYLTTWIPVAFFCIRRGILVDTLGRLGILLIPLFLATLVILFVALLPLILLLAVLILPFTLFSFLKKSIVELQKDLKEGLLGTSLLLLIGSFIGAGIVVLNRIGVKEMVDAVMVAIFLASVVIWTGYFSSRYLYTVSHDLLQERENKKAMLKPDVRQFVLALSKYKTRAFRNRFIRRMRQSGFTISAADDITLLESLALRLEHNFERNKSTSWIDNLFTLGIASRHKMGTDLWDKDMRLKAFAPLYSSFGLSGNHWDNRFLDELYVLIEGLKLQAQHSDIQVPQANNSSIL